MEEERAEGGGKGEVQRESEYDAEECERFSGAIMLYFFAVDPDSDFRPVRPNIFRIYGAKSRALIPCPFCKVET
ncbi:hypothetical protein ACC840_36560, partial [Rhizobium ruizarguesonis]